MHPALHGRMTVPVGTRGSIRTPANPGNLDESRNHGKGWAVVAAGNVAYGLALPRGDYCVYQFAAKCIVEDDLQGAVRVHQLASSHRLSVTLLNQEAICCKLQNRRKDEGVPVVEPLLVGQFEFVEWTPDGRLRHSRFMGLREDTEPGEIIREP